jgi:flagellar protein FlbD
VITLTRSTGSVFALNSDLIERVDSTPQTTVTLIDGTAYQVRESLLEVVDRVRRYRGSVIAAASMQEGDDRDEAPEQDVTPGPPPDGGSVVAFPTRIC